VNFSVSEVILILLIALIVIKPEQLPDVAFSLGRFAQTIRRMMGKMKSEVSGFIEEIEKPVETKRD